MTHRGRPNIYDFIQPAGKTPMEPQKPRDPTEPHHPLARDGRNLWDSMIGGLDGPIAAEILLMACETADLLEKLRADQAPTGVVIRVSKLLVSLLTQIDAIRRRQNKQSRKAGRPLSGAYVVDSHKIPGRNYD
jgi:hypothetical protein